MTDNNHTNLTNKFFDAAYQYLMSPNRLNTKKLLSTLFLLVASAAYTFSAMPSTVHFYRSVVAPIEVPKQISEDQILSKTEQALNFTNEAINTSQVFAVPVLLMILEFISIILAVEFWRASEKNKSSLPIPFLFICCQSYPVISVIFQVADINRQAKEQSDIQEFTSKIMQTNNKKEDISSREKRIDSLEAQKKAIYQKANMSSKDERKFTCSTIKKSQ